MVNVKKPEGPLQDLAHLIYYTEAVVHELKTRLDAVMAGPRDDVQEALSVREDLVVAGGKLVGLMIAWEIITGQSWELQGPAKNVQLA